MGPNYTHVIFGTGRQGRLYKFLVYPIINKKLYPIRFQFCINLIEAYCQQLSSILKTIKIENLSQFHFQLFLKTNFFLIFARIFNSFTNLCLFN